jgi:predicted ATPase/DNA-binding CsgD family transcriptional regulator/tetratricopeptide (TPR) repeat protein
MRDDSGHETRGVHNLPARLTSFVGREHEIAEVGALLADQRLVTLVGAPGVGKTRLALQLASQALSKFPDGVWLVELAPLADALLVPQAVANALGVREQPGRTLTATLAGYLRTRRLLLLLDNCEHLAGAAAALAETLLQACTSLHILATSREPLAIEGEVLRRVPSLTVPDAIGPQTDRTGVAALADSEAVRLFVERAPAADSAFALTERNAVLVGQICTRLDGIPLAIELAAARVRALSVEQIAARLDDRFQLLTGGSRTALPRQQTLRGAVDWSYDLLPEPEQALLRRLSVFAGGFTLDAVNGVARDEGRGASESSRSSSLAPYPSSLDALVSLVDKSLVQVEEGGDGERRYRLLETFRQYGLEKLIEHGELASARNRHRDYFLAFAEEVAPALNERADSTLLTRLEREHDNLRVALGWCLDEPGTGRGGPMGEEAEGVPTGVALGVRLATAIWQFWWLRGHMSDGRRLLARVLAASPSDTSLTRLSARAYAPLGLANLSPYQGGNRIGVALMTENLAFCRETGDDRGVAIALARLGSDLAHLGEFERGAHLCEESVALGRQVDHPFTLASALSLSSVVAYILKRYEQSIALAEEAINLFRPLGNVRAIGTLLRGQSLCVVELGDLVKATLLAEDAFRIAQQIGDKRGISMSYKDLGRFALLAGDHARANELLGIAMTLVRQMDDRWLATICISVLAGVKVAEGTRAPSDGVAGLAPTDEARQHLLDAARLFAAADLLREQDGMALPGDVANTYHRDLAVLHERLGESAYTQARTEGRAMSFEQAVGYALATTALAEPGSAATAPGSATAASAQCQSLSGNAEVARLTPREQEVAVLVADGHTNREIAEALVLSERTVDSHVRNIMGKLAVGSRAQIAAWTVEQRLGGPR